MAVGTEPRPKGRMLEYEQFVDHQIHLTRSKIRATEVLTALVVMAAVVLGLLFLEIVLDHWIGLPLALRALILFAGFAAGGYSAYRFVVKPLMSSVNSFYAARRIEAFDPRFNNSLLNYLDLRKNRDKLSPAVLRTLEARAVRDLAEVQVESAIDQRQLTRSFYALAGIVVLFCIYVVLTPKNVLDSAKRALLADVSRPTNTRLINIKPGDDEERSQVVSGSDVMFAAEVDNRGILPDEIRLHYSGDGGDYFDSTSLDPGERRYDPWAVTLRNVQQRAGLLPHGERFQIENISAEGPSRASGRLRCPGAGLPRLHRRRASGRGGRGQRSGPRRDARYNSGEDESTGGPGRA